MVAGVGNIPSRHLYIKIYPNGTGMCGHPPYSVGRYEHAPTHGREPTQHNREVKGSKKNLTR